MAQLLDWWHSERLQREGTDTFRVSKTRTKRHR